MRPEDRQLFWELVESGDRPLLSVLNSLIEKWGLPEIIMTLGESSEVLAEDAVDAELTPNQRGLILGACAQVSALSDQISAEMDHLIANPNG